MGGESEWSSLSLAVELGAPTSAASTQSVTGAVMSSDRFVTASRFRRRERWPSPQLLVLDHVDDVGLPPLPVHPSIPFAVCYTWGYLIALLTGFSCSIRRRFPSPVARHAWPPIRVLCGSSPQSA